ncbi:MAG: acetylxylan esterase [Kiritimatiellia bacterium]|nr:acetylxylan esterase [Kiritimatiellia bacterium]MDP6848738.1 acetylxylan esterase [Kiritimatiellia bacterium]
MLTNRITTSIVVVCTACVCWLLPNAAAAEDDLRILKYSSREKARALLWQKEVRTKLVRLLKIEDLLSRNAGNPLNPKTQSSEDKGKYVFHEMEINSTPKRRIKIVLTLPKNAPGPFPSIVAVAGHGGTRHSCYVKASYQRCAHVLAEQGYVTISTRVSQHKVHEEGRTLLGERLWDLMRCVDFLASLEEVDQQRIGCLGNSLGGEMVMWLAAIDERMRATVSSSFLTKMDQLEKNHCMCWKFPGLRELVDFSDIYSSIAPRALLCQNGLKEPPSQFPVPIAREAMKEIKLIYQNFEQPEKLALVAHEGGHEIHLPSLLTFFEKHLGHHQSGAKPQDSR